MAAPHIIKTPHGDLKLEAALSNGLRVVLVTIAKPFFPAFSFCISLDEGEDLLEKLTMAIDEAHALELQR